MPHAADDPAQIAVTEGIYSRDNHDLACCLGETPDICWIAWSAYEAKGSRSFVRCWDGNQLRPIESLEPDDSVCFKPLCIPSADGAVAFVWIQKHDGECRIRTRQHDRTGMSSPRTLVTLPTGACPGALDATVDSHGALWLTWTHAVTRANILNVLKDDGHEHRSWTASAGEQRDYRPVLCAHGDGVTLAWDAYANGRYAVYWADVEADGPGDVKTLTSSPYWSTRAQLCATPDGEFYCVWVQCRDVIWKDSVVHQRYDICGARRENGTWTALQNEAGDPELVPLHYGLLTDFDHKPPALGHQGRRLHPVLRRAAADGVWLFYETKQDDAAQTLGSLGRLVAHRMRANEVGPALTITEGNVYYELPKNTTIDTNTFVLARTIVREESSPPVDECVLEQRPVNDHLPPVPREHRSVDLRHWRDIQLPCPAATRHTSETTSLPGQSEGRYHLIWGDFHVHSVGSVECEGELDELAHYARDKAGIQALTISDNDHFWNVTVRENQRWLTDAEWDDNLGNAKVLDEPGRFALFPGYEQTIGGATLDIGRRLLRNHSSIMADDEDMERDLIHFDPDTRQALEGGRRHSCKDVVECLNWARQKGYLPLPHAHVNWWRLADPDIQPCCDVTSAWMRNIECFDIYYTYLNDGWRYGFTGSSDSHYRNPGLGGALTGLWVTELSRAAVLDALRARRTYATAGQRILLEFTLNERFMGEWFAITDDPVLQWRIAGNPDENYTLRIRRDGRIISEKPFQGDDTGTFTDENLRINQPGKHYYFLEVVSDDPIPDYRSNAAHALGGRAWSTPIWIETADWLVA